MLKPAESARETVVSRTNAASADVTARNKRLRAFLGVALVLTAAFFLPLFHLVIFAAGSELYSHILLVPFITFYLIWQKRSELALAWRTTIPTRRPRSVD